MVDGEGFGRAGRREVSIKKGVAGIAGTFDI